MIEERLWDVLSLERSSHAIIHSFEGKKSFLRFSTDVKLTCTEKRPWPYKMWDNSMRCMQIKDHYTTKKGNRHKKLFEIDNRDNKHKLLFQDQRMPDAPARRRKKVLNQRCKVSEWVEGG